MSRSMAGNQIHTSMSYLSSVRAMSAIICNGGSGKCGLSAASSDRGGISSAALVPKTAKPMTAANKARSANNLLKNRSQLLLELDVRRDQIKERNILRMIIS